MKRIAFILAALAALGLTACAQKKETKTEGKVLVAYFSATGITEEVARKVAAATGGTLYEIRPVAAYTADDLDWNDKGSRSSREMDDTASRPGIVADLSDAATYDVVYLGFPIWWGVAPRVVNTFVEQYDLAGKAVVPFATSGGSGIDGAVSALREAYPGVKWQEGKLLNGMSQEDVNEWIQNR